MSDASVSNTPSADVTLGDFPVLADGLHNVIIAAGATIASLSSFTGFAGIIQGAAGLLAMAVGFGLSAIHVSRTSSFGRFLGSLGGAA